MQILQKSYQISLVSTTFGFGRQHLFALSSSTFPHSLPCLDRDQKHKNCPQFYPSFLFRIPILIFTKSINKSERQFWNNLIGWILSNPRFEMWLFATKGGGGAKVYRILGSVQHQLSIRAGESFLSPIYWTEQLSFIHLSTSGHLLNLSATHFFITILSRTKRDACDRRCTVSNVSLKNEGEAPQGEKFGNFRGESLAFRNDMGLCGWKK